MVAPWSLLEFLTLSASQVCLCLLQVGNSWGSHCARIKAAFYNCVGRF